MSGGHFNSQQYAFTDIAEEIKKVVSCNNISDSYGYAFDFSDKTICEFHKAIKYMEIARIYANRVDWLLSGDDSETAFHERLEEDKKELLSIQELKDLSV